MMLIFIFNTVYIVAPMDGNIVASKTQYFAPKDCFDLNEPLQEGIINYFICDLHFIYHRI